MQTKVKYLVPVLLSVFIFSFMGCKTADAAQTTAAAETRAITAETTTPGTTQPEKTTAETTTQPVTENIDYSIGDTGPAGGLIFYINPNSATDGWKYLEAAASDLTNDNNYYFIPWNNEDHILTGVTAIAIGSGISNTQEIVNMQGEGSYAAKLCSDLTKGGYSDWFLPSIDELNLMHENLYLNGLGSFEPDVYWSSSEINIKTASSLYFNDGGQYYDYKHVDDDNKHIYGLRVRAARAF